MTIQPLPGMKFPARYTMNLVRDTEAKTQFVAAVLTGNQKVSSENIKLRDVKHYSWEGKKRVALLEVNDFLSTDELANRLAELTELWGIE